jgi:predicted ATP-grasp superfamily ATP-dependent carboligase
METRTRESKQPIAIVGASTRAAASSAIRAGFQPVTADLFADADLRAIATTTRVSPYPEGLLDWLRAIEPPGWMYTGALENYPELVDQMAWIAPLWGNPGDVLIRVRSPVELARALGGDGLKFPETRDSADGLPRDGSWLIKTYRGASGSDVRELRADVRLPSPTYFQQRIGGIPCAAVFAAIDDTSILLGVTQQIIGASWLGAHGFQYAGSIGPVPTDQAVQKEIQRIGQVLTQRFELAGLFGVDFMLDGDAVRTIEVNPRYTASVEICERMSGVHALQFQPIDQAGRRTDELTTSSMPQLSHGKATLFARRDVILSQTFAEMALAEALRKPWPELADVSPAGTLVEGGRPILTVFAEGSSVADVEQRLRQRVSELESEIYGSSTR